LEQRGAYQSGRRTIEITVFVGPPVVRRNQTLTAAMPGESPLTRWDGTEHPIIGFWHHPGDLDDLKRRQGPAYADVCVRRN
jgi:hypothetical protein